MVLDAAVARALFAGTCSARLATVRPDGGPHLVPIVFALVSDCVYFVVDAKPKSTTALQRLANIEAEPRVAVLADHYTDDWTQLWWSRADGRARVIGVDTSEGRAAMDALSERYPIYTEEPPPGPVVAIDVERWTGWRAAG
jgi:PPOX class probable F420-dependent enzyme